MKLLYLALLIWVTYKLVKAIRTPPAVRGPGRPKASVSDRVPSGELVQDPQCGVYIPKETALAGRDGEYFCSETCREAHRARPR